MEERKKTIKAVSVNKELFSLKHAFKKAEEWKHVLTSAARVVKVLKNDGVIKDEFLSRQEYERLLQAAKCFDDLPLLNWRLQNEPFRDLWAFSVIATETGQRVGEVLNLEFADINFEHGYLRVTNKPPRFEVKNHQNRIIPLTDRAMAALKHMLAKKHDKTGLVFHRKDGNPWTNILGSFKTLVRFAGIRTDITPHSLRRTFGSWLACAGIPMRTIQKLMGHQSVVVTEQHYAHLSPDTMKSAMQVLNDFLPKSLPSSQESGGKALLAGTVSRLLSECRGRESNPYAPCGAQDFKSCASASFATPAHF
jgi:integrase